VSRFRIHLQLTAEMNHAFLHTDHAKPFFLRGIEPVTIVLYGGAKYRCCLPEVDPDQSRAGVPGGVANRLLHNAEDACSMLLRQFIRKMCRGQSPCPLNCSRTPPWLAISRLERNRDRRASWEKQQRDVPHNGDVAFDHFEQYLELSKYFFAVAIFRRSARIAEPQFDSQQNLTRLVMKLPAKYDGVPSRAAKAVRPTDVSILRVS
jgi:hypothetical protein